MAFSLKIAHPLRRHICAKQNEEKLDVVKLAGLKSVVRQKRMIIFETNIVIAHEQMVERHCTLALTHTSPQSANECENFDAPQKQ